MLGKIQSIWKRIVPSVIDSNKNENKKWKPQTQSTKNNYTNTKLTLAFTNQLRSSSRSSVMLVINELMKFVCTHEITIMMVVYDDIRNGQTLNRPLNKLPYVKQLRVSSLSTLQRTCKINKMKNVNSWLILNEPWIFKWWIKWVLPSIAWQILILIKLILNRGSCPTNFNLWRRKIHENIQCKVIGNMQIGSLLLLSFQNELSIFVFDFTSKRKSHICIRIRVIGPTGLWDSLCLCMSMYASNIRYKIDVCSPWSQDSVTILSFQSFSERIH